MQSTYSVIAILKKEQRLKRQKGLIMLRITVDGKRAEISIKRKLDPARWDSSTNRVKGNKEEAREINSLIDSMILKVNRIHNTLLERDITITASEIKNVFLGRNANHRKLLEIFTLHNEMMASRVGMDFSKSTSTRYNTTYDHVAQFVKRKVQSGRYVPKRHSILFHY